ncbi:MAG: hypothetical protein RLY19_950 [Actinomycetota bacterium]
MIPAPISQVRLCSIVAHTESLHPDELTNNDVQHALAELALVSAWVESHKLMLTRRLQQLASKSPSIVAAEVLSRSCGISRSEAKRGVARVNTLSMVPQLESSLNNGFVSIAHVDAVTQAFAHLSDSEKQQLAARGDWMNKVASHTTPDNFARAVRHAVQEVQSESGVSQLEQQRRRTYLRHWVDRDSGMVCIRGEFDPESGLTIVGRLQSSVDRIINAGNSTSDPRTLDRLRALGLVALVTNVATDNVTALQPSYARAEVSVVVDLRTLQSGRHSRTFLHTGTDVHLPIETVRRIACEAKVIPVVLGTNGVVLDVGRSSRLATAHQRRALESMHSTCAIPDCTIPVGQCQPHHIAYWNSGGPTDIANLVPLCASHHRCAHEGGWKLTLDAETRRLTVRQPGSQLVRSALPDTARMRR